MQSHFGVLYTYIHVSPSSVAMDVNGLRRSDNQRDMEFQWDKSKCLFCSEIARLSTLSWLNLRDTCAVGTCHLLGATKKIPVYTKASNMVFSVSLFLCLGLEPSLCFMSLFSLHSGIALLVGFL